MAVCSTILQRLYPYLDGELGVKEALRVEAHLSRCRSCREAVALERRFLTTLRSHATPTPAPASMRQRVSEAIAREAMRKRDPPKGHGQSSPSRKPSTEPLTSTRSSSGKSPKRV